MTRFKRLTKYSLALLLLFTAAGCTAQTEVQKKFGPDADYFIGLRLLQENDEKAARDKFNHCIKKGSYYCAKKSAEALCTFGNIQERNLAASNLINLSNFLLQELHIVYSSVSTSENTSFLILNLFLSKDKTFPKHISQTSIFIPPDVTPALRRSGELFAGCCRIESIYINRLVVNHKL